MSWLVLAGFAVILWQLFERTRRLERRIDDLEVRPPASAPNRPSPALPRTAEIPTRSVQQPPPMPVSALELAQNPVAEPEAVPAEEGATARERPRRRPPWTMPRLDFEDLFGRRLPIWGGGIALALAGIFLVRLSIEAGLLTPAVRVALSFVFGLALIAAAEIAYRYEERVRDPRVRQALAGAGLATLYAAFYLGGTVYGLIGSAGAFAGLAAVTAAAIALSWRFGLPSAVLGLVGGFAAPALVASEEANVPLLTLYLALVTGGLAWASGRQGRPWLGYLALAGGFLWGALLLLGGFAAEGDLLAFGLLVTLLGAGLPLLLAGDPNQRLTRLAAAVLASLQMAALVESAGNAPLTWALYLLLGAALAVLGWRDERLREGSAVAAALGLWLLLAWDEPEAGVFAAVAASFAAVFLLVPLAHVWRGRARPLDLWQLSLAAPALAGVVYWLFGEWEVGALEPDMAGVAAALALVPALAALREWREGTDERLLIVPLASAALLAFAALLCLLPAWLAPVAASLVAIVLLVLLPRRGGVPLAALGWAAALVAIACLLDETWAEWARLGGGSSETQVGRALLRWFAVFLPLALLAKVEPRKTWRHAAEALAALLAYGVLAQVLPGDGLAWTAAIGTAAILLAWREREAAAWALGAVAVLWALDPLGQWLAAATPALAGLPMMIATTLGADDALLRLAPLMVAAGVGWWALREGAERPRTALLWLAGGATIVTLHVLFKQVLAIGDYERFVNLGMAERTVWEVLLFGGGVALLRFGGRERMATAAGALFGLSLAHVVWFTLVVHNPLLAAQAVGSLPVANWLLPAYGVALAGTLMLRRLRPARIGTADPLLDGLAMTLVAVFALSSLRHAFAGSILTSASMSQTEDLLRSLAGIVLALGFLWWGSASGQRSWRVGSLVLMLGAVAKVFLVDTAGLEGLLRIASFMALGFSLIGIGWVYSRQLRSGSGAPPSADIAPTAAS